MRLHEPHPAALGPRAAEAAEAARQHFGHMSDRQREAILNEVRFKLTDRRRARVVVGSAVAVVAAGSCAALAVALFVRHHGRSEPISFRVEGAELRAGGYVEAGPSSRPVLRFSDGSEVALSERTRAHVRTVDERGAQVTLDEGQAHAYVTHSPATRWSFDAGPFVVTVTGTAFGISWVADEGRLDVRLENGTVTVSGPVFDTPVALRAGQWLTVRARDVLIRDLDSTESDSTNEAQNATSLPADRATNVPPVPMPRGIATDAVPGRGRDPERESTAESSSDVGPPRRAGHRSAAPAASTPNRAANHQWAEELADGKFAEIVDEALRIGLDTAFSSCGSDDLAALADAARYTRHYDLARGALLSHRRRFPASERAHVAAFSLGRLSETQQDVRVALSWFETYLMEAPDGVYASEALGRKMVLVQQLDGNEAARPLAEAYVQRFPSGTYAQTAHALTLGP
jgi:TolA-binding protein